jgi:hypothetical protein
LNCPGSDREFGNANHTIDESRTFSNVKCNTLTRIRCCDGKTISTASA